MHSYLLYAVAIHLRLLLANAQGTASCSQTRSSDFPQATDIASIINSQASSACSQLQAATSLPLSVSFQGYGLRTNASSSSLDTSLCQNVLSNIAQSCVLNANYYGGLYLTQRQMFDLSNKIYPQNPILSGLGSVQASTTVPAPSSTQGIIGETTTSSQSSPDTTSSQAQSGQSLSPSAPSATPVLIFSTSASTIPASPSSISGQSTPQTSQTFQGSNTATISSLGSSPFQSIAGSTPSILSSAAVNGGLQTKLTSSWSQAASNGTSGPQPSTTSVTGQMTSISGSIIIPKNPTKDHPPATVSTTVTGSAAAASATQAVVNANSTITDLTNNPDSQDAKQAALDAINAAETAAKVAAIAWLLSALGPAVAEAELVVAGTAPVSDLVATWAAVEAAEQQEEEDEEEEEESASLSIASQIPSTSPPVLSFTSSTAVSASSTLSSSSSAVSGTCALYTYPSDDEIDEGPGADDTGELTGTATKRRARIRRFRLEVADEDTNIGLDKRGGMRGSRIEERATGSSFTSINGCNFPNGFSATQPNYLTAGQLYKVGQPKQIGGSGGKNGLIYNAAQKWYFGTHDCTVEPGFAWSKVAYWYPGMLASKQSVDHVWELNLLTLFLNSMIGTSSFSCNDMNTVFFPGTAACDNKMQTIFNQLPSMDVKNIQNGFIGLEQSVNGIKGFIFGQGLGTNPFYIKNRANSFQNQVGALQDACMAFAILSQPEVKALYDLTNNRVYQAFLGVDALITNNALKDSGGAPLQANWASSFKTWMTNYLETISGDAWSWAEALLSQLQEDTNNDATLSNDQKTSQLRQLSWIEDSPLWGQDQFTLNFGLSWTVGTLALRSLMERDDSCPLSPASASTAPISSSNPTTISGSVASTLGLVSTSSSVVAPVSIFSTVGTPVTSSGSSVIPTTSVIPTVVDIPTTASAALIASIVSVAAVTHTCPSSSYSKTTNFAETMPQGTNTFNLDFDASTHPEILVPGTQWMFAEVDGYLSEWSVMGSPVQPDVLASNGTFIQFDIPLEVDMTSIVVIGVSIPGLTDNSAYSLNLYAWGAASTACGGSLPLSLLPAAPPSTPQLPTTTAYSPITTAEPAYGPTESSSCAGGSSLCRSNPEMGSMCQTAFARYVDNFIYTNYTSLSYTNAANEAFTGDGCSAFFQCGAAGSSSQPYAAGPYPSGGMSGADMKTAFGLIGCSVCGWHNLAQTGCQVKLDACNGCVDWVNGVDLDPTTTDPEPWCNESKC